MAPPISPLTSIVLDAARFGLALLVAAGHWTQPQFQEGWPDLCRVGVAAVGGFFVLSGFTIRLLTPEGDAFSPSGFAVERLSRLWSVALPAVLLTIVLDSAAFIVNPAYYAENWGHQASSPFARVVLNVAFVSQLWGRDVELFSNSLFWSLSYEAGFYFLYWAYRSTRGHVRYLTVFGAGALLGPNIVLLLGPWLAGVLLHDVSARRRMPGRSAGRALVVAAMVGALAIAGVAFVLRHDVSRFAIGTTRAVQAAFQQAAAMAGPLPAVRLDAGRVEGELIVGAIGAWLLLFCALSAIRGLSPAVSVPTGVVRFARRLGDFTFPLYLFHFPMFVFLGALAPYDRGASWQKAALFLAVLGCIYVLMPVTTSLKWSLRRALSRLGSVAAPARASSDA